MVCPPVRALASGLSHVQVDKHGKIFYTTYFSVDLANHEMLRTKDGKGGLSGLNIQNADYRSLKQ